MTILTYFCPTGNPKYLYQMRLPIKVMEVFRVDRHQNILLQKKLALPAQLPVSGILFITQKITNKYKKEDAILLKYNYPHCLDI